MSYFHYLIMISLNLRSLLILKYGYYKYFLVFRYAIRQSPTSHLGSVKS